VRQWSIPVIGSGGAGTAETFCPGVPGRQGTRGAGSKDFPFRHRDVRGAHQELLGRDSGEAAMLIPSIDLMGGRIVQLVRGETLKAAFDDLSIGLGRFSTIRWCN